MTITTAHELATYLEAHPLPVVVLEGRRPWIITETEDLRAGYDAWSYESHVEDNGCKDIAELRLPLEVLAPTTVDTQAAALNVLDALNKYLAAHGGASGPTPVG
jgi:hypothetical protein